MKNILVVDDDQEIGFMLKVMLEHRGFTVSISESADEIEKKIAANKFDLIILDMLIAGKNGIDVCTHLKSIPEIHSIPILMITAFPDSEAICLQAGANDFLSKPFEMENLVEKINKSLNSD